MATQPNLFTNIFKNLKNENPLSAHTLTEIEILGLQSECNMADGHAYHDLAPTQAAIITQLPQLWAAAAGKKHQQAEADFRDAFLTLAQCPSLHRYKHFRICPTASNSIDIVATWLKEKNLKTLLIEPTFDNLALILKRRGVAIDSILEDELTSLTEVAFEKDFDALFLVNPNNPTGRELTEHEFTGIVSWCRLNDKVLLLDNTFRFFVPQTYDTYQILQESGVTFISIEDTGKVWPTQDMKASLLFFSKDIAVQMHVIYEEIYLCVSNFQLEVLAAFLKDAHARGLDQAVWNEVRIRRQAFREIIHGSFLKTDPLSQDSKISVEWVKIHDDFGHDYEVMDALKDFGLIVLPGRHFFWNQHGRPSTMTSLRFSLLKTKSQFTQSLETLKRALNGVQFSKEIAPFQQAPMKVTV